MALQWQKIKEKHPKAYDTLWYWDAKFGVQVINRGDYTRFLYDFFDENEIIINICFAISEAWYYNIDTDVFFCTANDDTFKSRTKAETAAFTKAFEILEEKL